MLQQSAFVRAVSRSKGMGKIVFDLDNTLYSFGQTGLHVQLRQNILEHVMKALNLDSDAAEKLSHDYYTNYGLTARGLKMHHPDVCIDSYLRAVHDIDHTRLPRDDPLREMLIALAKSGWELWVMTNGTTKHAEDTLARIGVVDLFEGRIYDCVDQWEASKPEVHNKPEVESFAHFAKHVKQLPDEPMVMVEDSMINLHGPARLGWKCVWISHGAAAPANAEPSAIVLRSVYELPQVLADIKP
jgi:putative hydrolase of the HAD superfamily